MSPFEINLLLHCHTSPSVPDNALVTIYRETIDGFLADDLVAISGKDDVTGFTIYTTTERGQALVEMWCNTPLPVMKFVDPRFEEGA